MRPRVVVAIVATIGLATTFPLVARSQTVGAAPKGDPAVVASKIIKYNFPKCQHVSNAARRPDGSIRAVCDGIDYLVFTVFNAKEGKVIKVALNCTAAKSLLNVAC
jgi:hypothetical protein